MEKHDTLRRIIYADPLRFLADTDYRSELSRKHKVLFYVERPDSGPGAWHQYTWLVRIYNTRGGKASTFLCDVKILHTAALESLLAHH